MYALLFRQRPLPGSVGSELSSAQNNLSAKVAFMGMAGPGCLQWLPENVSDFDVSRLVKIEESAY